MKKIHHHHRMMLSLTRALLLGFKRPIFLYLTTLSFTLISVVSVGIYFFEKGMNPQILNLFDALYYTVTITTGVGLGDISPISIGGRLLSMGMMLLGTALFVSFTACLATSLLEHELEHDLETDVGPETGA
jgi:voltage-gated potassium channel